MWGVICFAGTDGEVILLPFGLAVLITDVVSTSLLFASTIMRSQDPFTTYLAYSFLMIVLVYCLRDQ